MYKNLLFCFQKSSYGLPEQLEPEMSIHILLCSVQRPKKSGKSDPWCFIITFTSKFSVTCSFIFFPEFFQCHRSSFVRIFSWSGRCSNRCDCRAGPLASKTTASKDKSRSSGIVLFWNIDLWGRTLSWLVFCPLFPANEFGVPFLIRRESDPNHRLLDRPHHHQRGLSLHAFCHWYLRLARLPQTKQGHWALQTLLRVEVRHALRILTRGLLPWAGTFDPRQGRCLAPQWPVTLSRGGVSLLSGL